MYCCTVYLHPCVCVHTKDCLYMCLVYVFNLELAVITVCLPLFCRCGDAKRDVQCITLCIDNVHAMDCIML